MAKKIKIGQIGVCHEHAQGKMDTLRKLDDVYEIVGVVDDRDTQAAKFAGGDVTPYEGLTWMTEEELFATPGLEAVAVEVPNNDLVPTARRCMERNLAMHMDKPAGEDLGLYKELLDGCKERNVPLQLGYMFRGNPAMQWCRKAVREGWLGEVFEVQGSMSHNYGGDAYQEYLANFQGGIMFNLGCHLIDFVVAMLGRPERITPVLKHIGGVCEASKNNCLSVLEYPHAWVALHACSYEVEAQPYRRLKVCGTKGTVELMPMERFDGKPLQMRLSLKENTPDYAAGTHTVDFGIIEDRYEDQLRDLAAIIRGEKTNPYTYEHDYLVHKVILAASGYTAWG